MKSVIAIDPGDVYGIALLDITNKSVQTFDRTNFEKFRLLCIAGILDDTFIAIEDVHSIYGASAVSTFGFGRNLGIWTGFFLAFNRSIDTKVSPAEWQNEYLVLPPAPDIIRKPKAPVIETEEEAKLRKKLNDKMKAERRKVIKSASMETASEFAGFEIKKDGIADAVNIARYVLKYEIRK